VASHFVEYFARRHELSVLCFYSKSEELELAREVAKNCAYFKAIPLPGRYWLHRQAARVRSLVGPRPFVVSLFDAPAMRREIGQLTDSRSFDLVQMDCAFIGQYVDLFEGYDCKTTLVEIDVHVKPLRRRFEQKTSPWGRGLARLEWRQMRSYEPALCEKFDLVYGVSEDDCRLLESMNPRLRVALFRYGADPELFDVPAKRDFWHEVLFLGSFSHRPNVDAALWFYESVVPLIRAREPKTRFRIVGGEPPAAVRKLGSDPAVTVTGWVPDVTEHLAQADVCVVPLRRGGGVKLKTLEMMAAGRAIVTTQVGCEGIGIRNGTHLVVAESAEEFAVSVVGLLRDPERRLALGRRARELASREHRWSTNLAQVEREYERLVAGSRALEVPSGSYRMKGDEAPSGEGEGSEETSSYVATP
jgi:glycosyltransferase involved in cell wall biosynthesis